MSTQTLSSSFRGAIVDQLSFQPDPRAVLFVGALLLDRGFICPAGRLRKRREEEAAEGEQGGEERKREGKLGEVEIGSGRALCSGPPQETPRRNWIRSHCQGHLRVEGRVESWGNSGSAPF